MGNKSRYFLLREVKILLSSQFEPEEDTNFKCGHLGKSEEFVRYQKSGIKSCLETSVQVTIC